MRQFILTGIKALPTRGVFQKQKLIVGISNDRLGKSLSIYDEKADVMYEIPMEKLIKELTDD